MYAEPTKCYAYQGLVVSSVADNAMEQSDLVLLLNKEQGQEQYNKMTIYGVSKQAFVPPNTERDFLKTELAKNRERRYAMPLRFGDIVQWNDEDCDHSKREIICFRRERPLYPVSSCNAGHLLKLGGVIQPNKPTTFWTQFKSLTIPVNEATRAEPDVWLHAWIKFEALMLNSMDPVNLELTFMKFDECDYSYQGRVFEAPWHRNSLDSKFKMWAVEPPPDDSDEEDLIDCEPPEGLVEVENKWAEIIHKQLGLYVGERLIVCKDLPQYDFIIPLLNAMTLATDEKTLIYPSVGEYFHFSAIWSSNHRAFLVRDMMPYLTLRSHMVTPNGNLCVRVNHSPKPGLFVDHEESLGLIDDPNHCLSFFEFHPMSYESMRATVEVRAVRSCENRTVRYRIVRPIYEDEYMNRYREWIEANDFSVGPITGLLINSDTVISARHPNVYFRFQIKPDEKCPPYGTGIRFRARRQLNVFKEMLITEWLHAPEASVIVSEKDDLRLFQLRLHTVPDHEQLAMSPLVGLVDTRQYDAPKNAGEEYVAWCRESPLSGDCRRAATILEVHSTSANPTFVSNSVVAYTEMPSSGSSIQGSHVGSYQGSSCGYSRQSGHSFISSRFVGPKSSNKKSTDDYTSSAASSSK